MHRDAPGCIGMHREAMVRAREVTLMARGGPGLRSAARCAAAGGRAEFFQLALFKDRLETVPPLNWYFKALPWG